MHNSSDEIPRVILPYFLWFELYTVYKNTALLYSSTAVFDSVWKGVIKLDKTVVNPESVPFVKVSWGQTKELVGKFCKAYSENILIKITEYLPSHVHEMHVHPEQEEIIIVLSGEGETETASGKEKLYPGYVLHIPAGVPHATYNPYDNQVLRAIIVKSPPDKTTVM